MVAMASDSFQSRAGSQEQLTSSCSNAVESSYPYHCKTVAPSGYVKQLNAWCATMWFVLAVWEGRGVDTGKDQILHRFIYP